MSDGEALLAAIIRDPAEDTPRLMYADWLQENGHGERAEFIRVQCELAGLRGMRPSDCDAWHNTSESPGHWCPLCEWNEKFFPLERREQAVWNYGLPKTWVSTDHFPFTRFFQCIDQETISQDTSPSYEPIVIYQRGFPTAITCTAVDWLAHADAILPKHPITKVTLTMLPLFETGFSQDRDIYRITRRGWVPVLISHQQSSERQVPLCVPALEDAWPGIEFAIVARNAVATDGYTE